MIKRSITKEEFDKLSEEDKPYYIPDGDKYKFSADDLGKLKRGKDHESKRATDANAKLKEALERNTELETQLEQIELDKITDKSEAEKKKLMTQLNKLTTERDQLLTTIKTTHSNFANSALKTKIEATAKEISTSPKLAEALLRERMSAEYVDGNVVYHIKGDDGEVDHSLTVDNLITSIVKNPDYAAIVKTDNKSSGTGETIKEVPSTTPSGPVTLGTLTADKSKLSIADAYAAREKEKQEIGQSALERYQQKAAS